MNALTARHLLALLSLLATGGFLFALFSQHVWGMQPCAWCILQRMICLGIAIVAGLAWWLHGRRARSAAGLTGLAGVFALGGMAAAWYQHTVAAQQFSCDLSLADRVVTGSGLDAALPALFGIYATCADSSVDLAGVRYELWTLTLFALLAVLALLSLAALWRARRV